MAKTIKKKRPGKTPIVLDRGRPPDRGGILPALVFLLLTAALLFFLGPWRQAGTPFGTEFFRALLEKIRQVLPIDRLPAPVTRPRQPDKNLPAGRPQRPLAPTSGGHELLVYHLDQSLSRSRRQSQATAVNLSREERARKLFALLGRPGRDSQAPLSPRVRLLAVSFQPPTITLDLSAEFLETAAGFGARDEQLIIFCLCNSFLDNFPEYSLVQLLVEGRRQQTLAGHIDISQPIAYLPQGS
ncbi:MAG: GerMN domain-containing protein [Deltaproteobacteria bacterium]|nr:GerMN domain-containing protein [Deltaproteobacteria bacterium]